jgi:hypothetical protein
MTINLASYNYIISNGLFGKKVHGDLGFNDIVQNKQSDTTMTLRFQRS